MKGEPVKRSKMKPSSFAIPKTKKYPVSDIAHARNAISRVGQHGTPAEKKAVYDAVKKRHPSLAKRSTVIPTADGTGRRTGQPKGSRNPKR